MAVSVLFVSLGIVGFAEKVVDADVIKAGNLNEDFNGRCTLAGFIVRIRCLRDVKMICQMGLSIVMIFAKIADTTNQQGKPSFTFM